MRAIITLLTTLTLTAAWATPPVPSTWPGFEPSPHFGEWVRMVEEFEPDARYLVNVAGDHDPDLPTHVIFYGTPSGNTIEWTHGRALEEGLDWHFDIQHVAAQTRLLREHVTDRNLALVIMQPDNRHWPGWRRDHENSGEAILRLLEEAFPEGGPDQTWTLTGHSGGGSFTFGYLNAVEEIPARVTRIGFLDSNYAYENDEGHGDKLLAWLEGDPARTLAVVAHDDRYITWEGNRVVSPTGGTYRATTERMMSRLREEVEFDGVHDGEFIVWRGMGGQIDIRVHPNPQNRILHTEMVGEMNGLIHVMTVNTPLEGQVAPLRPGRAYTRFIQRGE